MKSIHLLSILAVFTMMLMGFTAKGQLLEPVKWSYAAQKNSSTEATLFIKATMDDGWHIYSLNNPKDGPVSTSFSFVSNNSYRLSGVIQEPKPLNKYEELFGNNVNYFEKQVTFQQKITLPEGKGLVQGSVEYMVCSDQQCLPPQTLDFSINVK